MSTLCLCLAHLALLALQMRVISALKKKGIRQQKFLVRMPTSLTYEYKIELLYRKVMTSIKLLSIIGTEI